MESPPREKKLSWTPTRSVPRTSAQMAARVSFGGGGGRGVGGARRAVGGGQGAVVDLAVRGERQRVEEDEGRGDQILRQRPREVGAQLLRPGGPDHVGGEVLAAGTVLPGQDTGPADLRVAEQRRFGLGGFDAVSADLDLGVGAAEEVEAAVGVAGDEVAGAVEAGSGVVGVGDEAGGGEGGLAVVAAGESGAAEVQLTGDADRDGSQGGVQDIGLGVVHGQAEWDRALRGVGGGEGAADGEGGRLGGAVDVDDGQVRVGGLDAGHGGRGGGLAACPDLLEAGEAAGVLLGEEVEEGLGEEDGRDAGGDGFADDGRGDLAVGDGEGVAVEEGGPDLVGGGVEGVGGVEEEVAVGAVVPAGVGGEGGDVGVGDRDALGLARGARGVHDVRQGVRVRGGRGPAVRDGRGVDPYGGDAGDRSQVAVGENQLRAAAGEEGTGALLGTGGVQRDVRAAGLEHRQQGDDQVGRTLQEHAHPGLGGDAPLGEDAGQPLGTRVQLRVGQPAGGRADGEGVGVLRHPGREGGRDR
ncbi:hypothetical protein GA0115236_13313 [Streptomyces sp. IgraMP-1]|nr:hypothetical protein GA0115236_13313 [Streptomyces sp. IgraMP-1]